MDWNDLNVLEKLMYTTVELEIALSRPQSWEGDWKERFKIGTGFFYETKKGKILLVTCAHVVRDWIGSVDEKYQNEYKKNKTDCKISLQPYLWLKIKNRVGLFRNRLAICPSNFHVAPSGIDLAAVEIKPCLNDVYPPELEASVFALSYELVPTNEDLASYISPVEPVHLYTFPYISDIAIERNDTDLHSIPICDDSRFPIIRTGNLAFPPTRNFKGSPQGLVSLPGQPGDSGSLLVWMNTGGTLYNYRKNSTVGGTTKLFFIGIHAGGWDTYQKIATERAKLHESSGSVASDVHEGITQQSSGICFYQKAKCLEEFESIF